MTALKPGTWIRLNRPVKPDAPLAVWRELLAVEPVVGWPSWMVSLSFTDGYTVPWHTGNLDMFETATTDPRV